MEDLGYKIIQTKKEVYPQDMWILEDDTAIYNGYHRFNVKEFKVLYEFYGHNATKVKKHWDRLGKRVPAEVVYSLRRFLSLPKFINTQGSWYDHTS